MSTQKSLLASAVTTITAFEISAVAQEEVKHQVLFTNVNLFDDKIYKDAF